MAALFDELGRFLGAAEAFQKGARALRPAAEQVGCSASALLDTINKLEKRYGRPLVIRGDKTTPTQLTPDGRALYDAIRSLGSFQFVERLFGAPVGAERRRLRVALSRSLFASPLLYPDLAAELNKVRQTAELELDVSPQLDVPKAISDIERGTLDVLLVWFIPESDRDDLIRTSGVVSERLLPPRAHIVFVASSAKAIRELAVSPTDGSFDTGRLARATVATVSRDLEPPVLRDVLPDRLSGGQRTPVGSIESVLSYVRSGIAEYGIIPAVYRELDNSRRLGYLFYSPPVARAGVDLLTHRAAGTSDQLRHVREFASAARRVIGNLQLTSYPLIEKYVNTPCWGEPLAGASAGQFPRDEGWYRKVKFGYYVDHDRDSRGAAKAANPLWRKERVELVPGPPRDGAVRAELAFKVRVVNQFGLVFDAEGDLFYNVLVVTARAPAAPEGLCKFRTAFNWCAEEDGVLYGTWRGNDPDQRPVSYANIWSHKELTANELQAVALHAMNTVGVMANALDDREMPAAPAAPGW